MLLLAYRHSSLLSSKHMKRSLQTNDLCLYYPLTIPSLRHSPLHNIRYGIGRWAAEISLEGGKSKFLYGKTRKEVQEKLKTALYEQQQGTLVTGPQQKVGHFLIHWLEDV